MFFVLRDRSNPLEKYLIDSHPMAPGGLRTAYDKDGSTVIVCNDGNMFQVMESILEVQSIVNEHRLAASTQKQPTTKVVM